MLQDLLRYQQSCMFGLIISAFIQICLPYFYKQPPVDPFTQGATWGHLFTVERRHIVQSYNVTPLHLEYIYVYQPTYKFLACSTNQVMNTDKHEVLVLGDGDFSYSTSLISSSSKCSLTSTVFLSKEEILSTYGNGKLKNVA